MSCSTSLESISPRVIVYLTVRRRKMPPGPASRPSRLIFGCPKLIAPSAYSYHEGYVTCDTAHSSHVSVIVISVTGGRPRSGLSRRPSAALGGTRGTTLTPTASCRNPHKGTSATDVHKGDPGHREGPPYGRGAGGPPNRRWPHPHPAGREGVSNATSVSTGPAVRHDVREAAAPGRPGRPAATRCAGRTRRRRLTCARAARPSSPGTPPR